MDKTEIDQIVVVKSKSFNCDGGLSGHPNIYLKIGDKENAVCPYCRQVFVLDKDDPDGKDNGLEN